jgi:hypothetical protein
MTKARSYLGGVPSRGRGAWDARFGTHLLAALRLPRCAFSKMNNAKAG